MDIQLPKIIEYIKTETIAKGRVRTRVFMFMIDDKVFDSMAASIITGELSVIESRIGATIKHPKDKYDKQVAKAEAAKRLKKHKLKVLKLTSVPNNGSEIELELNENEIIKIIKTRNNKIIVGLKCNTQ
jgi:hypothetical protein